MRSERAADLFGHLPDLVFAFVCEGVQARRYAAASCGDGQVYGSGQDERGAVDPLRQHDLRANLPFLGIVPGCFRSAIIQEHKEGACGFG